VPLTPLRTLLADARDRGYALGYFESWNLESLQGVVDAAEKARSPIILGFNGEFLTGEHRLARERIEWYAALGRAAAASASVPCGLIFNECALDSAVAAAADAGFNLVMPADASASYEQYEARVAVLARHAHASGAAIEAEIGTLPDGTGSGHGGSVTDPDLAARFVAATGVDLLAVSVGNVHIRLEGQSDLDLGHLEKIRAKVSTPLVLHGGTGITGGSLQQAIRLGVAKVNYGTYLKQRYLKAVRAALGSSEPNPHELLGIGGAADVMVTGRLAVRDAVLERLPLLGSCGRA
jgi:fructose/tagatose bisphosphate aldolase